MGPRKRGVAYDEGMADHPLDHLVYAAPDLDAAVRRPRGATRRSAGARAVGIPTRAHATRSSRSGRIPTSRSSRRIRTSRRRTRPLWLGVEGRAWPRLTAWACRAADLEALADRARQSRVRLGSVTEGSRRRADGTVLVWRFTDPHVVVAEGLVPFFIDWGRSPHPAASAPGGVTLSALRAEHPNPGDVAALLGGLELSLPVTKGPRPALIAVLETPNGLVELR